MTENDHRDVRLAKGALAAWEAGEDIEFADHTRALLAIIDHLDSSPEVESVFGKRDPLPKYGCTCR